MNMDYKFTIKLLLIYFDFAPKKIQESILFKRYFIFLEIAQLLYQPAPEMSNIKKNKITEPFDDSQDQEIQLQIEPAISFQQKAAMASIKDCEVHLHVSTNRFDLYVSIHSVYFDNLIRKKERPNMPDMVRSHLGHNAILYKQFEFPEAMIGNLVDCGSSKIKGNFHLINNSSLNIDFKVHYKLGVISRNDRVNLILHYCSLGVWKSKYFYMEPAKTDLSEFSCKIPFDDMKEYCEPNLLFNISVRKEDTSASPYLGMVNLGNTCYMNSCLQMLFFFRPLRKIILDKKSGSKLMMALKDTFLKLLDTEEGKPIDIQNLIETYGKFNERPRKQQDVQQFLLDFISELEKECSELKIFWEGKTTYTTKSNQASKPYQSTHEEQFCQLDVHMHDAKGNFVNDLVMSLKELKQQQQVDDLIQTDEHGKISVSKIRTFQSLPDLLFVNIKRYQFDKKSMRMSKIFSPIEYQERINAQFLVDDTPGNTQANLQYDYVLYSVIVHKGFQPNSGHYFSFVNTSSDPDEPNWYEFNDSRVRKSDTERVMNFTGSKVRQITLHKAGGKFIESKVQSAQSSYLLVYLRKPVFKEYQSLVTPLPKDYMKKKMLIKAAEQKKNLQDVKVIVFNDEHTDFDPFSMELDFTTVPLNQQEPMWQQLVNIEKTYLSCEIQTILKVERTKRIVKGLRRLVETSTHAFNYRRGKIIYDYLLIVPKKCKSIEKFVKNPPQIGRRQIGMLCIQSNKLDPASPIHKFIFLDELDHFEKSVQKKGGQICYSDENSRQLFKEKWNFYLNMKILTA